MLKILHYFLQNIRWITGIYLLILLLGSVLPLNSGTTLNNTYIVEVRSDYLLHFLMMLPLPVLVGLSLREKYRRTGHSGQSGQSGHSGLSLRRLQSMRTMRPLRTMQTLQTMQALQTMRSGRSVLSGLWLRVMLLGLLVVVFCEGIQLLIPYRAFNINDMFANGMGALLGLIPAWLLWRSPMNRDLT